MYKIPTVCQVLHKLPNESMPKSCKVGVKIPGYKLCKMSLKSY